MKSLGDIISIGLLVLTWVGLVASKYVLSPPPFPRRRLHFAILSLVEVGLPQILSHVVTVSMTGFPTISVATPSVYYLPVVVIIDFYYAKWLAFEQEEGKRFTYLLPLVSVVVLAAMYIVRYLAIYFYYRHQYHFTPSG